jgi:hypothetical protein
MTRKPLMSSSFISAANRVRIRHARAWVEVGPLLKSCSSSGDSRCGQRARTQSLRAEAGPRLRRLRACYTAM